MNKKIFGLGFVFAVVFAFTSSVFAQTVDNTPPTGTIEINGGALYTNTREVTLTLSATDNLSEIVEMNIANHTSYSGWEQYATSKEWTLSPNDAEKIVRVKFKDAAGNETAVGIPATITLDTVVPVITLAGAATIDLTVGDTYTDAGATALDGATDLTSSIVIDNPVDVDTAGTYTITYNVSDLAGNDATEVTRTVTVAALTEDPEENPEENTDVEEDIVLENGCEVVDTIGQTHTFPQDGSPSEYLAVCVLAEALEQAFINNLELTDSDFGLYLQSLSGLVPGATEFWALWLNGGFANCGIECLAISEGDTLSFILTDWMTNAESTRIEFHITSLVENEEEQEPGNGGGGNSSSDFDTGGAITYLQSVQSSNGSFENSLLYTDWAAIAYSAANVTGSSRNTILQYLASANTISSTLTDNERRAMALLALGQNPYSFHGVNYIEAITDSFDGTQLGDLHLDNDDIFGLIVLPEVGYTKNDEIVSKTISFILSAQQSNGSWDNSVDMTAAAIAALEPFKEVAGVSNALSNAADYIESEQDNDGGWGNVFSTSWAMQAESVLNASWESNSNKSGLDYLSAKQENDGAVSPSSETLANRIWATSYAIAAASEKSWSEIMKSVSKPAKGGSSNSSSNKSEDSENIVPQVPTDPVVCPPGDLFSTTTGEACTATLPVDSTISLQENTEVTITPVQKSASSDNQNTSSTSENKNVVTSSDIPTTIDAVEITPDALTASTINALPEDSVPGKLPIILGTVSGVILLYAAAKFVFVG